MFKWTILALCSLTFALGCGGAGSGASSSSSAGGPAPAPSPASKEFASANVLVDLKSGDVHVSNVSSEDGRAAFAPGAVTVSSDKILDEVGSTGRKVLSLRVTNNQAEEIGTDGQLRVTLSNFTNINATPTDVSTQTNVSTLAGSQNGGTGDGNAIGDVLQDAGGICSFDGAIYFTSRTDGKVKKLSDGQVTTIASGLLNPQGIATTESGPRWLFVAETGRHQVVKVPISGGAPVPVVGLSGGAGDVLGAGSATRFNGPVGLTLFSYRGPNLSTLYRLYVADSNNNKLKVVDDPYENATVTRFVATSGKPQHLANGYFDPQQMIFATTKNNVVQAVADDAPGPMVTVAGTGVAGMTDGIGSIAQFNDPQGITVAQGALIVGDEGNSRVRQLTLTSGGAAGSPSSWRVARFAGSTPGNGLDGVGFLAVFSAPGPVHFDGQTGIIVGDLNRIRKVTATRIPFIVGSEGGAVPTAKVSVTNAAGYSADGRPYFFSIGRLSPRGTQRVETISFVAPEGVTMFQFNVRVEGTLAQPTVLDGKSGAGSNQVSAFRIAGENLAAFQDGAGLAARFNEISGVWATSQGSIYIADRGNNALRRMDSRGNVVTILGNPAKNVFAAGTGAAAAIPKPSGIWMNDSETEGFITAEHAIYRLNRVGPDPASMASWSISTIAGSIVGMTEGAGTVAKFNLAKGILPISETELLVCDSVNNRIRKLVQTGPNRGVATDWTVSTFSSGVLKPNSISRSLAGDYMVASDANAVFLIAANGANQVFAGLANTALYVDGVRQQARFGAVSGIAMDSSGYIYASERVNGRIRRISRNSDTVTTVLSGGNVNGAEGLGDVASLGGGGTYLALLPGGDLVAADANTIWTVRKVVNP